MNEEKLEALVEDILAVLVEEGHDEILSRHIFAIAVDRDDVMRAPRVAEIGQFLSRRARVGDFEIQAKESEFDGPTWWKVQRVE